MKQISVQDLSGWLTQAAPPMVLDVREPWEVALAKGVLPETDLKRLLDPASMTEPSKQE